MLSVFAAFYSNLTFELALLLQPVILLAWWWGARALFRPQRFLGTSLCAQQGQWSLVAGSGEGRPIELLSSSLIGRALVLLHFR